jgi:hypothetical protein
MLASYSKDTIPIPHRNGSHFKLVYIVIANLLFEGLFDL